MSDLETLALRLRELSDRAQRFDAVLSGISQRAGALEYAALGLAGSGVDARRLAEHCRLAERETSAAMTAIQMLRTEIADFARALAD